MTREIALDTETTGFDPDDGHRIVEIGCVEMIDQVSTGEHFHVYINPERDMPEAAFRVHGLSNEFLNDKPLFKEVAADFVEFIADSPLVIHNAAFDMKFLNAELRWMNMPQIPFERAVDTVLMARRKFPGSPANLDALCKRFGIDLSKRTLHGALLDAELLAEVYLELTGGRQSNLMLGAEGAASNAQSTAPKVEVASLLDGRTLTPISEAEKQVHKAFVEQMKAAIWKEYDAV